MTAASTSCFTSRPSALAAACLCALAALAAPASAQVGAGLEPVIITGSTREQKLVDAPYAINAVGAEALRSAGPMVNLSEALASVPGLVVANRNNYAQDLQISSRGFGARAGFGVRGMRLYADGIPATMPDGQGQVAHFDLAGADRVEVLRGPFSALYGNSSGGVIAAYSKPVRERNFQVGIDAGSFGLRQQRVSVESPFDGGFSIAANFSNFDIDGFRPNSDADRRLANIRLAWVGEDDHVTLAISDQHQRANDPLGLNRALFSQNPDQTALAATNFRTRKTIDQTQAGLSWQHQLGGDSALQSTQVSGYLGRRSVFQMLSTPRANQLITADPGSTTPPNPNSAGGVIDFDRDYAGVDGRLSWRLGEADLVTGVNVERLRDARKGYENYRSATDLGVVGDLRRDETNRATTREAYAQLEQPLAEQWQLIAGVRTGQVELSNTDHYVNPPTNPTNPDDSGSLSFRYTNPVLGLRWQAAPTLTLHASASRGYESPTLGEVAYRPDGATGFNDTLQAQTSRQIELGAKWRPTPDYAIDAAVFRISTDNEIGVNANVNGRGTFKNVGRTLRQGLELSQRWRHSPTLRGQLALTVLDASYRSAPIDGNQIAGTQPASLFAEIAWKTWPGGEWGLEVRAQGRTALNDANQDAPGTPGGGFAAGWGIANLRYLHAWDIGSEAKVELLARVDNLADRRYAGSVIVAEANQRYFETAPGRNHLVSLRYLRKF
ncbi:TonB-dependent receptor [Leptothrix cholodnii SP-6]|uniref:TonB-dependent receptor n=1 Tax=Leptothrix cholodnii (strain ATCC 51168 / LMG 8142 / SP-6) TaxID=395495 RepID=B1XZW6_LEPCP|nr:TonB-dependent receptor [Leptothrix cholodnii]ACB34093.1 TonB-dependent receptor [Leptothrix cholodnii SP-6]